MAIRYIEAIRRPFTDAKKLLIGIILSIIPIVNFVTIGYWLENARTAKTKALKLPEWKNFGALFVEGLVIILLGIIYSIPAFLVFYSILGKSVMQYFINVDAASIMMQETIANLSSTGMAGLAVTGLLILLASLLTPAAALNYAAAKKNRFAAAFDFKKIFKGVFTNEYLLAWVGATLYTVIISGILSLVPYVGGPIATYVTGLTYYTLLGEVYSTK